ncbi:MAG TPA: hypothetical protein VGN65_03125 [Casimicrobiaceae bacterium]
MLIVVSLCGTAVTLRPLARDVLAKNRAWIAGRRQRAEWARESAVRDSRRRIVAARMQYAQTHHDESAPTRPAAPHTKPPEIDSE